MNDVIREIVRLHSDGESIDYVRAERETANRWLVTIGRNTMLPLGEGGDLPQHVVSVDRKNLPKGVACSGWERAEDARILVCANEEQIEAIMRDVAQCGEAFDRARVNGDSGTYPHFATKPMAWNRQWVKRNGKWTWASDAKIVLGTDGRARRMA